MLRMQKPALAFKEKQMLFNGEKAGISGHEVNHVFFENEQKKVTHGFKKLCNNDDYPGLLAKYSVAFSTLIRMTLGEKAAEDRLLYNDAGKIIGTISLDVPNFVPILAEKEEKPTNPKKLSLAVPDVKMLIKKKFAALLVAAYKHKNNDLHPGNISVNGLIDWDEYYYDLTSIIKGRRYLSGVVLPSPKVSAQLNEDDIHTLPRIRINSRVHWVGNSADDWLSHRRPVTTAFLDLEKSENKEYKEKFKDQVYTALLKELLSFDKIVLAERLKLYLGNEKLNLDELTAAKRDELLAFGKNRHLFYDDKGKERSFVDHCATFFEQEHMKFKELVLNMPEFRDFMIEANNNPKKLMKIKRGFVKQNSKNHITHNVPHNLNNIGVELHSIWRTCRRSLIDEKMKTLNDIIMLHRGSPLCIMTVNESTDISYTALNEKMSKFIISPESKSRISLTVRHDEKPQQLKELQGILHLKIRKQITQLSDKISELITKYYEKPDATITDNHLFIEEIKNAIIQNEIERKKLYDWLQEKKELVGNNLEVFILFKRLIQDMESTSFKKLDTFTNELQEIMMKLKLNQTIEEAPATLRIYSSLTPEVKHLSLPHSPRIKDAKSHSPKDKDEYSDSSADDNDDIDAFITEKMNIDQLSTLFKIWNKPEKASVVKKIINDTHSQEYYSYLHLFSRRRGANVVNKTLNQIFSEGGWASTSLNTLIMKNLCLNMLTDEVAKSDPFKKSIYDRIAANNADWWSKVAPEIAANCGLKTPMISSTPTLAKEAKPR